MELKPIAHIETDFPTKFGVPRQSGLVRGLRGRIVFEPEYRDPEALRGLEGFSHIWLLWDFSEARRDGAKWQPTVRPPRLGGNRRMGVFATRSPFRPNNIGLSSVRILSITWPLPTVILKRRGDSRRRLCAPLWRATRFASAILSSRVSMPSISKPCARYCFPTPVRTITTMRSASMPSSLRDGRSSSASKTIGLRLGQNDGLRLQS